MPNQSIDLPVNELRLEVCNAMPCHAIIFPFSLVSHEGVSCPERFLKECSIWQCSVEAAASVHDRLSRALPSQQALLEAPQP